MFLFNVYVYENKLYYPLRAGDVCIFTFRWRAVPQRKLHLQLSSSIMASSRPASAPASWAGPRRVGLPAVGHFRRARVSFDSAFKLSCRTSAAATFSAVLWQKNRPYHQPDRAALIFFRHEFWSVWGGPARFCEQDSGSRWTITAVALLTAARCIIFFFFGGGDSSASSWTKLNRGNVMLCMWTPRFRLLFVFFLLGSVCLLRDIGKQQ